MKLLLLTRSFRKTLQLFCFAAGLLGITLAGHAQQDTVWGVNTTGGTYYLGTLFYMNSDGSNVHVVHNFGAPGDGTGLTTSLAQYKGVIYGMTAVGGSSGNGTIFSYDQVTATYAIVYNFDGTHGNNPVGKLTLNPANGLFYGITTYGGANNNAGTIFSFDPATNTYADVFDMDPTIGGNSAMSLYLYNNKFYGLNFYADASFTNYGASIFSFDPATNTYNTLYDRPYAFPFSSDIAIVGYNNVLYGAMQEDFGGDLFSYDLGSGAYTNEVAFTATNGWQLNGITLSGSTLYGVTYGGNYPDSYGTIFSYSLPSKQFSQLYKFSNTTAYNPSGNPVMANGKIIGMTYSGGANSNGGVYSFDPAAKILTGLLDFDFTNNGGQPNLSQPLFIHPIGVTPQSITFNDLSKAYGDAPFDPGGSASSGLPIAYSVDNPDVAVAIGNRIFIKGAGTAIVTATQYGNSIYDSISETKTITVSTAPLLITAVDTFRNQNQPNPVFRAAYTGLVNGDSLGALTVQPALSTTADLSSLQGTYPITIGGAVDPNYDIIYAPGTLTVVGLLQQIAISDSTAIYGGPDLDPGSASSGLPVIYTSSDPSIALITADQKIHIVSAGSTVITVTQAGDAVYALQNRSVTFRVLPAPLTIAARNETKVYTQPDPVFSASYSGFVNGDDSSSLTIKPVFTPTAGPGALPGVYLIHVDGAADSNYVFTYQAGTYLLTPVEGAAQNSLNAWFSSTSSLQLDVWLTAAQQAMVQIYDLSGHQLINKEVSLIQGNNVLSLPVTGLSSGTYIARVSGDKLKLTQTIRKIN